MRPLFYILFVIICFTAIKMHIALYPSHAVSEAATEADLLIGNSRLYAKEHAYNRSLLHLEMAINTIKKIEQELDPLAQQTIDKAVLELESVHKEIKKHNLIDKDMNHAFIKTMNALTYAELKITEHFIESEDYHEAMAALKSGMIHIQNALKFAQGGHKDYELKIYAEMDSLLQHNELSKEEIVEELEKMLAELNSMVAD